MGKPLLMLGLFFAACAPNAGKTTEGESAAPPRTESDPDLTPTGTSGLPAGYLGRTDRPNTKLSDAKYVVSGNRWEITTGPAHIVYAAKDLASGNYTVSSTIEQLAAPRHREAFGIMFAGRNLDTPAQKYSYFVVAGTGEMLVKHRDGDTTRDLIGWHKTQWVPAADAQGRQTYRLEVRVAGDSVKFVVNNTVAAALSKSALNMETDGIAGLRINHNLSLRATPVVVTRN